MESGDTLSFLLYHLSLPSAASIQSNLHSELTTVFPPAAHSEQIPPFFGHPYHLSSSFIPKNYAPCLQIITRLPYLDAVLKETLRLYTAIPRTLPRVVSRAFKQGKVIDGLYIPPGTVVGSFAYGVHRNRSVFGSDEFDPERWNMPELEVPHETQEEGQNEGIKSQKSEAKWMVSNNCFIEATDDFLRVKIMEKQLWAFGS